MGKGLLVSSSSHAAKLAAAKQWLGTKWCLHPQSTYKPRWCSAKV